MGLILHKETVRKLIVVLLACCKIKKTEVTVDDDNERPVRHFVLIIDESTRRNPTICEV